MISSFIEIIFKLATAIVVTLALAVQRYFISPHLDPSSVDRPKRPFHDPPDFEQCNRLQELLIRIQHHILESITTQQCYAAICEHIKHELQDGTLSLNSAVQSRRFSTRFNEAIQHPKDPVKRT